MSSDDCSHHPAVQRLYAFFDEMQSWEAQTLRQHDALNGQRLTEADVKRFYADARQRLAEIFARHVEEGANARRVREPLSFGHGSAMGYNGVQQPLVSLTERGAASVLIETRPNDGLRETFRYELTERAGVWKIRDNRKHRPEGEAKWKPFML